MTKELQDLAWSVLPKEFKEEVKEEYFACKHCSAEASAMELEIIFGEHNLTSDAEGEEMLTVSRKRVQEFYAKCKEVTMNPKSYPDYSPESALSRMALLDILFGSKCLPDETNLSESLTGSEPKPSEPKEEADEHFDTIVKGCFRNERRLNIAAQITASIYANDKAASRFASIEALVRKALEIADTLIAECEKGGNQD